MAVVGLTLSFLTIVIVFLVLRALWMASPLKSNRGRLLWTLAWVGGICLLPVIGSAVSPRRVSDAHVAPIQTAASANLLYAQVDTPIYAAPEGDRYASVGRGVQVRVEERLGEWIRMSGDSQRRQRWVRLVDLGVAPPLPIAQQAAAPPRGPHGVDLRFVDDGAVFAVGESGHTVADVDRLWLGVAAAIRTGTCSHVDMAMKSTSMSGAYLVHCGREPSNRFFRVRGGQVHWCPQSGC
jgi:hypothetical protein